MADSPLPEDPPCPNLLSKYLVLCLQWVCGSGAEWMETAILHFCVADLGKLLRAQLCSLPQEDRPECTSLYNHWTWPMDSWHPCDQWRVTEQKPWMALCRFITPHSKTGSMFTDEKRFCKLSSRRICPFSGVAYHCSMADLLDILGSWPL